MFCHKCGAQITDDASFCTECGSPVISGETSSSQGGAAGASRDRGQHEVAMSAHSAGAVGAAISVGKEDPRVSGSAGAVSCPYCGSKSVAHVADDGNTLLSFVWVPFVIALVAYFFFGFVVGILVVVAGYATFFAMYVQRKNAAANDPGTLNYRCDMCGKTFSR